MGAFSNLDLERQYSASDGQDAPQAVETPQQPAQPQGAFASPFVSGAFSSSPYVPMGAPGVAATQNAAPAAPQQAAPVVAQQAQTSVTTATAIPAAPAPVQQVASPAPAPAPTAVKSEDTKAEEKKDAPDDEDAKRKEHEAVEAKRKAEHEAKFAERRKKEQAERERIAALSDDAVMAESMERVSKGFEQLTRRNMKDMVSEYIQTMCVSDPAFSRNVMNPVKSMINCIKYINNKAREYIQQEMKNNDIKPENGIYGGDVPDDIVFQWAVDYFNDPNANLAIICANRPDIVMTTQNGMVFVYPKVEGKPLSARWNDDAKVEKIIHELNFGAYAGQRSA